MRGFLGKHAAQRTIRDRGDYRQHPAAICIASHCMDTRMELDRRHLIGAAAATVATGCVATILSRTSTASAANASTPVPATVKRAEPPSLLRRAMAALDSHHIPHRDLVGLVDFAAHSSKPRFQLVDIAGGALFGAYLVAHGKGSDPENTGWLHSFSNEPGSNASSGGSFRTSNTYYGKHGHSRRLVGLDPDNDQALSRAIVMHGASYVQRDLIDRQGHIGRSQGCFAVSEGCIHKVLDLLGEGRLLFAAG